MKILEVIRENKKVILKRGLIVVASIVGLLLATKLLTGEETQDDGIIDVDCEPVESTEESIEG